VLGLLRLARRETPQYAITGVVGVGFAAFVATRTGKAENFFLPGLLLNAAYAAAYFVSILIRRPLIGVLVAGLSGSGRGWRDDPVQMRAYTRASWLWVVLFGVRLLVQLPLYLAGSVTALGVAKTAMGLPLFGIGIWLTWLLVREHADLGEGAPGGPQPSGGDDEGAADGRGDADPDSGASLVR
jgi:hypothetical protein